MACPRPSDRSLGVRVMRRRTILVALVGVATSALSSTALAQNDGLGKPRTQRTLSPAGETEVNYFDGGTLTHSTRIPADSAFNTAGRGSGGGGVAQPCFEYSWFVTEPNPNAVIDPVTSELIDATTGLPTSADQSVEVRQPST